METSRPPTEEELEKAELFLRLRAWLAEMSKDQLVLLAAGLMLQNGLPKE
jgi:hypothetical protein